ncbi:MAG: LPD38 domain-containing protein [Sulfuriferula sp.]
MPFTPLQTTEKRRREDEPGGFIPLDDAPEATPENPAVKTLRAIGQVYPVAETAANFATQAVALPVAGLAGLGALATNALGLTDADPASVVHAVGNTLTYQPKSDLGQHLTEAAMYPFTKLQEAGEAAGDKVFDATGSPAAATATRTVIEGVLPMAIVPAAKGARKAVSQAVERRAFSPSEAQRATPEDAIGSHIDDAMSKDVHIRSEYAKTTEPTQAGAQRLADDAQAMSGAEPQGFQALRSEGDQGLHGVAGELRAVPEGHGAGADATALAGQEGRAGELRAGELPLDDPAATGEAPHLLQTSDAARPDIDGGRSGSIAGTAEQEHGTAPADARPSHGEPASREVVPQLDVADIQQRDPAIAGMGASDPASGLGTMGQAQARVATGSGHDAAVVPNQKSARYALIEADTLKPSHDANLRPTPDYPEGLARPDWTRENAEQRVQDIVREIDPARLTDSADDATGAPIVTGSGLVEAGNARAIALQRVYQANGAKAEGYRQYLRENAGRFGLQPQQIDAMRRPVLVRVPDQPDSATLSARTEPDTLNSWAPGANYVPLVDDAVPPASMAKTVADLPAPIRRENIIADFAKGIGTSIYEGRVKGQKRLGFFRPRNEEVRIKRANDVEVAAHEVAHLIDSRVPDIANAWRTDKALREELKSVSYDQKNVKEGFAEGVRLFLTQPDALEAKAPKVYAWLESFTNTHEYGPALRKAQADMTAWFGQDALNRARSKIGTEKPLSQHLDGLFDRMRQATVDDLHGIYKMERDLTGKISPAGPYESARLSRAAASISDGAVRYGHPVKQSNGSFTFKGKGLEEILKPVSESLDDAMLYFVGRSSRELLAQGREHLFTQAEIDAMLKLATPERKKAFDEYQAWNRGVLDFAEAQGVINSQARATWQRTQYLPFHRVGQSDGFKGSKPGDWSGVKALTGGTENIKDVLANMVQNAAQLVDKAVKNEARVKIADLADKAKGGRFMVKIDPEARPVKIDKQQVIDAALKAMGINRAEWHAQGQKLPKIAEKVIKELENSPDMLDFMVGNQPPAGMNVVAVLRNGKPEWYEVGDPLLYRALSSIDRTNQHWLIKWLGLPKRVGQASITLTPDFWIANLARDTIMGSVMSRSGFRPVIDSLQGMRLRMVNDPVYKEYIANGGGLSSIYLDETKLRAKMEKFYNRQGIDYRTVLDTPDKLLGFVETLGDAFEMSTRLGEFKKALEAGENPRHAAYQGREVSTDFAMRGDSQALGMMYDTVMFLKPAVLSWDRLARGLAHDPNRGAIAIKAGALAMSSAALYLLNRDDPRYQDLPDWDRDANWHFFVGDQHFRYPKIWEVGALSSAAERTVERTLDENPENLGKDFARILGATFNLNLMPQIMAPIYEQATNRNGFTGAPIETPGMENMQPFLRAKPGTSETMKAIGMSTADMPESLQVNPARTEALLRGYFNTWAMYGLMLSDQAFFHDQLPEKRTDELPVVRRFYAEEPARHTKYEEQFYDLLEESKRLRGTMRELDRIGRQDIADRKEQDELGQEAKPLERAAKNLQEINAEMRLVRRDSSLGPEDKRARLDELTIERNALIKATVQDAEGSMKAREQTP